jgi:hypothetical protein
MQHDLALHLDKILAQLREERDLLDQAILDLERLHEGRKRPRGRPPGQKTSAHRLTRAPRSVAGGDIG